MELVISALLILAVSGALSFKWKYFGLIGALAAAIMTTVGQPVILMIFIIALLNLASLDLMRGFLRGVDYTLVGLIFVATVYAFYTQSLAMLLTMFVAASVPTYMFVMTADKDIRMDVGIKYITFMVIATILFIIGAVILISSVSTPLYYIGYAMLLIGLAIEVGVAPFHEWVPDVFDTADPIPISVVASIAKFVPFVVAYKILTTVQIDYNLLVFTGIIASISMFIGNIGGLTSTKPARILAYSTVANMGYILATLSVIARPEFIYIAFAGAMLQLITNAFGKVGFFVGIKDGGASPLSSYLIALSFIGLPPLMGFWGKFYILLSLIYANIIWLAAILVINSAMSVPYYIRLARLVGVGSKTSLAATIVGICALIMFITTVPPDWIIESSKIFMDYLTIGGV